MKKDGEVWRPIEGEEDYWVSNMGRVRYKDKLRKIAIDKDGYCICYIGKLRKKVHRLVGFAFIPNPDPEHRTVIDHIDSDKTNNHVSNLHWVTVKENTQAAYDNNLIDLSGNYDCLAIDQEGNAVLYKSQAIAAKELDVNVKSVSDAARGKIPHIKGYRFMRVKTFVDRSDWDGKK